MEQFKDKVIRKSLASIILVALIAIPVFWLVIYPYVGKLNLQPNDLGQLVLFSIVVYFSFLPVTIIGNVYVKLMSEVRAKLRKEFNEKLEKEFELGLSEKEKQTKKISNEWSMFRDLLIDERKYVFGFGILILLPVVILSTIIFLILSNKADSYFGTEIAQYCFAVAPFLFISKLNYGKLGMAMKGGCYLYVVSYSAISLVGIYLWLSSQLYLANIIFLLTAFYCVSLQNVVFYKLDFSKNDIYLAKFKTTLKNYPKIKLFNSIVPETLLLVGFIVLCFYGVTELGYVIAASAFILVFSFVSLLLLGTLEEIKNFNIGFGLVLWIGVNFCICWALYSYGSLLFTSFTTVELHAATKYLLVLFILKTVVSFLEFLKQRLETEYKSEGHNNFNWLELSVLSICLFILIPKYEIYGIFYAVILTCFISIVYHFADNPKKILMQKPAKGEEV